MWGDLDWMSSWTSRGRFRRLRRGQGLWRLPKQRGLSADSPNPLQYTEKETYKREKIQVLIIFVGGGKLFFRPPNGLLSLKRFGSFAVVYLASAITSSYLQSVLSCSVSPTHSCTCSYVSHQHAYCEMHLRHHFFSHQGSSHSRAWQNPSIVWLHLLPRLRLYKETFKRIWPVT